MPPRKVHFLLPSQVDKRLDDVPVSARVEGNRVSRSDIVAALIWAAPLDGDAIGVMVRSYLRGILDLSPEQVKKQSLGPRPLSGSHAMQEN